MNRLSYSVNLICETLQTFLLSTFTYFVSESPRLPVYRSPVKPKSQDKPLDLVLVSFYSTVRDRPPTHSSRSQPSSSTRTPKSDQSLRSLWSSRTFFGASLSSAPKSKNTRTFGSSLPHTTTLSVFSSSTPGLFP